MTKEESIKDTLDLIRRALEDDNSEKQDESILILNRKVNDDGTVKIIKKNPVDLNEINDTIDKKINSIFEKKFDKWFDKRLPEIFDKYKKDKK